MSEMLVKDSHSKTDFIQKVLLEEGLHLGGEIGRHNTECKKMGSGEGGEGGSGWQVTRRKHPG